MLPGKSVSETSTNVHQNGSAEEQTRLEDAMRSQMSCWSHRLSLTSAGVVGAE